MKIKKAYFLRSCNSIQDFPQYPYPEFAFMGRSNVGKSSLINRVTGQKGLVKVGSKPGVTKSINFFVLNDNISAADFPGFGFAKLPLKLKKRFLPLIKEYISSRKNLHMAFLLIDIRRIPDDFERDIITILSERGIPIVILATKCDKLSKNMRNKKVRDIASALMIDTDSVYFTSAKTGEGIKEILKLIETSQ